MVLEGLGDSLRGVLKRIANATHIDPELVKEVVKDIQRALLRADVNVQLSLNNRSPFHSSDKPYD